jgi:hypothetical protein
MPFKILDIIVHERLIKKLTERCIIERQVNFLVGYKILVNVNIIFFINDLEILKFVRSFSLEIIK